MADLRQKEEAARRAADVLLRSTGGRAAMLRVPMPAVANSLQEELGLSAPEFQDLEMAPVAFRRLRPQTAGDGRSTWELLVSAACVEAIAGTLEGSETMAASVLFANAYGVLLDGVLMEIQGVSSSDVTGSPCVYRLTLRPPATQAR